MYDFPFTKSQLNFLDLPWETSVFLEGMAGSGKTTAGVERLLRLLRAGVRGDSILLLVPQRTLASPYNAALRHPGTAPGGVVPVLTVGGLAQRMVDLFWPLVSEQAGFKRPDSPPIFLTLETAQYFMARLVQPLLDEGMFDSVVIDRNRLFSQILDNLNKAAVVGFSHEEIGQRLSSAWVGEPGQLRVYEDVQICASRFRQFCFTNNLLDFSLQVETFWQYLWSMDVCRDYLMRTYRHLVYDNLEEDTPVAHSLVSQWLQNFESALLVYDHDAGYRRFLGADPKSGYEIRNHCSHQVVFDESLVMDPDVQSLSVYLSAAIEGKQGERMIRGVREGIDLRVALEYAFHRFYPQMLDWVVEQVASLIQEEAVSPGEIVILAPYLSDALRFSIENRLNARGILTSSHRPSRSLRDEPVTQCLFTLAALAHPQWGVRPERFDVAYALMQAIDGLDLVRAQLLSEIVYRNPGGIPTLSSFDRISPDMQERITYHHGEYYEHLRKWLGSAPEEEIAFDHFLSRLFGEVLSQPGYGYHVNHVAGEVTANLIESVQKFRLVIGSRLEDNNVALGKEFIDMVQDGTLAAQYIRSWQEQTQDAVMVTPAYTFLMSNRPVDIHFWLDVGSRGWFERLYQPLTHPYVLSRTWQPGKLWTDIDEVEVGRQTLDSLITGLLRRCRHRLYLGLSELGENGYEQRGPLLHAFQKILRQSLSYD